MDDFVFIVIIVVVLCIFTVLGVYIYKKLNSTSNVVSTESNQIEVGSSNTASFIGKKAPVVSSELSLKGTDKEHVVSSINTVLIVPSSTPSPTEAPVLESDLDGQIGCSVEEENKYSCTHPLIRYEFKEIEIIDGPLFKISFSNETVGTKIVKDYYIIYPLLVLIDFTISLSKGKIKINTKEDFISEINKLDKLFIDRNPIPNKCLNVSRKDREESKPPYNTTCAFFPGFNGIQDLLIAVEQSLVPFIPENVLKDYYNTIDAKIKGKNPRLTLFEYIMYVASMNKILNTEYEYKVTCDADVNLINCTGDKF